MKKIFLLAAMAAVMMTACSNDASEYETQEQTPEPTEVVLTFSPYDIAPMTRAATSIADVVTRLDVWILHDGTEAAAVHQTAGTAGFGSIAVTLDKNQTYTLYAVGHKASEPCTLRDGLITFGGDGKVTQAMWYTAVFTPAETATLSCLMQRIVGQFRLETTDAVPEDVTTMTFEVKSALTQWNVAGYGAGATDRTTTYTGFDRNADDGTANFTATTISTADEPTLHTIVVTATTADGTVRQQRTFTDVPIRNGYKTTYRGEFFTSQNTQAAFTVESDWQDYDVTTF